MFTGRIPSDIGNLTKLTVFGASCNILNGNLIADFLY